MKKLFPEEYVRTCISPKTQKDKMYDFYNNSASPENAQVRRLLNKFYANFPTNENFIRDIKDDKGHKFLDRFYELFVFQLFLGLGCSYIERPKRIPNDSHEQDFLFEKDGIDFLVEATIQEHKETKIEIKFYEDLEKRFQETYESMTIKGVDMAKVMFKFKYLKIDKQPRVNKLIDKIICHLYKNGFSNFEYDDENVNIEIEFRILKDVDLSGCHIQKAGGAWWGDDGQSEKLRKKLHNKVHKYEPCGKPFLLCVNLAESRMSFNDIDKFLMNFFEIDENCRVPNKKYRNLNGIIITQVHPYPNSLKSRYWFYLNPSVENKVDFRSLGLSCYYIENSNMIFVEGLALNEILDEC